MPVHGPLVTFITFNRILFFLVSNVLLNGISCNVQSSYFREHIHWCFNMFSCLIPVQGNIMWILGNWNSNLKVRGFMQHYWCLKLFDQNCSRCFQSDLLLIIFIYFTADICPFLDGSYPPGGISIIYIWKLSPVIYLNEF